MTKKKWKSMSEVYINCDICGKKILFTRKNRQRCSDKGKGKKNTECQKEAARRLMRGEIFTVRRKPGTTKPNNVKGKRHCLKCDDLFKPIGKYNRICEGCTIENEGYKEVATSYNIPVGYNEY